MDTETLNHSQACLTQQLFNTTLLTSAICTKVDGPRTSSNITDVLRVEPVPPNGTDIPDNSVLVKFHIVSIDGNQIRTKEQTTRIRLNTVPNSHLNDGKWLKFKGGRSGMNKKFRYLL